MLMMAHDVMDGKDIHVPGAPQASTSNRRKEHPGSSGRLPRRPGRQGINTSRGGRRQRGGRRWKKRRRRTSPWSLARGSAIRERLPLRSRARPGTGSRGEAPRLSSPRASQQQEHRGRARRRRRGPRPDHALLRGLPRISLLLIESGVEFEVFLIDAGDKPDWFINAYDKAETPAMMGSPGGLDDGQWVGESKDIIARACEQNEKFKELCEREGPITVEQIEKYANAVAFGMILGYIAPTEEEAGKGLAMGLHKQAGLEPIEGETGAALRERCNAHFRAGLAEFEKMIGGLTTPFIGGDTPSKADVFAATTLFFSHNIAESGLCGDPSPWTRARAWRTWALPPWCRTCGGGWSDRAGIRRTRPLHVLHRGRGVSRGLDDDGERHVR